MRSKKSKLSQEMITYFKNYDAAEGLPSFEKFADTVGLDGEDLRAMCEQDAAFAKAYRRCLSILRDRLTDAALMRRYDPSFCKYVLDSLSSAALDGGENAPLEVEVHIV